MDVTALGGPHDGDTIALPDGIREIQFQVLPDPNYHTWLAEGKVGPDARVEFDNVTYQVVRWYTGPDDAGNMGRTLMVVIAPDHWPKAGPDRPLYHPWQRRGI